MCGIAGSFGEIDRPALGRMVAALAPRGPDGEGQHVDEAGGFMLGHRRLAIIDLSPAGAQPMSYAGGRLWVTYNGELYNHAELRAELERLGHRFRSRCDTEVLLAAYAEWGPDCVRRFRGMFAFALADRQPPAGGPDYVLARDRLGIKPLLYTRLGRGLWFASEMRALLATGRLARRLNPRGLLDLLLHGNVIQPETVLDGAQALPPGYILEGRGEQTRLAAYWDLHEQTANQRAALRDLSEADAVAGVRERLLDSARAHLVSDVPVGAFLSGGLDSSAAVALLQRAGARDVRTFCLGGGPGALDERGPAREVARALGTTHEDLALDHDEVRRVFPDFIRGLDRPSVDGFNTWLVSQLAARRVKVAVSGLGSDEFFGGYGHFPLLARARHLAPHGWPGLYATAAFLRDQLHLRGSPLHRMLFYAADPAERLGRLRRVMASPDIRRQVLPAWSEDLRAHLRARFQPMLRADADGYQQVTYAEARGYLLCTLLRDTDVVSMASGLEVRPLFLDHPLAEYVYALPERLKMAGPGSKRLLAEAVRPWVPEFVVARPKQGFELPYGPWMEGPLRDLFTAAFYSRSASLLLDHRLRQRLTRGRYRPAFTRVAWSLGILLLWIEQEGCYL